MIAPVRLYLNALFTKKPIKQQYKDNALKGMIECIESFNNILIKNRTRFIAGEHPTIADFLLYH